MLTRSKNSTKTFIQFIPSEDRLRINAGFRTFHKQDESGFDYYIEGFNLYFSVDTKEKAEKRINNMVTAFFNFWLNKQGEKKFILELHKLGFRAQNHDFTLKQLLNNKHIKARLDSTSSSRPEGFDNIEENEYELEVA